MDGNDGFDRMTTVDVLVPPRRLGSLLSEARVVRGFSLEDAAARLGGRLSSVALLEAETGHRTLDDRDLAALAELYGIDTAELVPPRSELVIDLTEGTIAAGPDGSRVTLVPDPEDRAEVLARYLTLVYSMRRTPPGTQIPLRVGDMVVLSEALGVPVPQVTEELRSMMDGSGPTVEGRLRRLRGRVLVPAVGVLVAATAAGALVLVTRSEQVPAAGAADAPAMAEGPAPQILDAVVQERAPDGSAGPVVVRD